MNAFVFVYIDCCLADLPAPAPVLWCSMCSHVLHSWRRRQQSNNANTATPQNNSAIYILRARFHCVCTFLSREHFLNNHNSTLNMFYLCAKPKECHKWARVFHQFINYLPSKIQLLARCWTYEYNKPNIQYKRTHTHTFRCIISTAKERTSRTYIARQEPLLGWFV